MEYEIYHCKDGWYVQNQESGHLVRNENGESYFTTKSEAVKIKEKVEESLWIPKTN